MRRALGKRATQVANLPRASKFDVSRLGNHGGDPVAKSNDNKLRTIVRAYVRRNTEGDAHLTQRLNGEVALNFRAPRIIRLFSVNSSILHKIRKAFPIMGAVSYCINFC